MKSFTAGRFEPLRPQAAHFIVLLRRYPDLRPHEIDELVEICPQLSVLELGLMCADDANAARYDAFLKDNAERLRRPFHQKAALLIPVVGMIVFVLALVGR